MSNNTKFNKNMMDLGIERLSLSAISTFLQSPLAYYLKYVLGVQDLYPSSSIIRGLALQDSIDKALSGQNPLTEKFFRELWKNQLEGIKNFPLDLDKLNKKADKDLALVINLESCSIEYFKSIGVVSKNEKVNWTYRDVPFIGYMDYVTADSVQELKCTSRVPSSLEKVNIAHIKQVCMYAKIAQKPRAVLVYPKGLTDSEKKDQFILDCKNGELSDKEIIALLKAKTGSGTTAAYIAKVISEPPTFKEVITYEFGQSEIAQYSRLFELDVDRYIFTMSNIPRTNFNENCKTLFWTSNLDYTISPYLKIVAETEYKIKFPENPTEED